MNIMRKIFFVLFLLSVLSVGVFAGGKTEAPEVPPVTSGTQYISPNGDGVQDSAKLSFTVKLYVKSDEGYVPGYGLRITSPKGDVVYEEKETEASDIGWFASIFRGFDLFELQREVTWDGTDQAGAVVNDGEYGVTIQVQDAKKKVTEIEVDSFVVDTIMPKVDFKPPAERLFSPNGDEKGDVFIVLQENGTTEDRWEGIITDSGGKTVKNYIWENSAPDDVLWDGTDNDGKPLADGSYSYSLSSVDRAGNKAPSYAVKDIVLNAGRPVLSVSLTNEHFSPNGDGVQDTIVVTPVFENAEEILDWSWSISTQEGVLLSDGGEGLPAESFTLDGFSPEGRPIHDGVYTFAYSLTYLNSYQPVQEITVYVDTTPPVISVEKRISLFSPDGDGQRDSAEVRYTSNENVVWTAGILNMNGEIVYNLDSSMTTTLVVWDGIDMNGNPLEDGRYVLVGEFKDLAGNFQYVDPVILTIDTTPVFVDLSVPKGFSPNDDGDDDTIEITMDANQRNDVEWWRILIRNEAGEEVYSFGGENNLPESVQWDGKFGIEKGGDLVPEGLYRAELAARYTKGTVIEEETHFFSLDISPPKVNIEVTADPFEQTDEGIEGSVYVSVKVEDGAGDIDSWSMDIVDATGNVIRSYAGEGDPSGDIAWNTGDNGNALPLSDQYTLVLTVVDSGGNATEFSEAVPIDILVIRKDGKLYLMVPNIIFGAYKYSLASAGPAMEERNMESIAKVVDIWKKYPRYQLGLEAHALNIYLGKARESAEEEILYPLTERRAASVFAALTEKGIPADMIRIQAYGGRYPIVSVTDKAVWWKNRRVEFIMIPPENME